MHRVVVTGLGISAPNGTGIPAFTKALREARSGVTFQPRMNELRLACQVAGTPHIDHALVEATFLESTTRVMNSSMTYAGLAAVECWRDAGFCYERDHRSEVDWNTGAIIGTGVGGMDTVAERLIPMTNAGEARRMGSGMPEQYMSSAPSAFVGGLLGLGGQVTTVSSACASGTESIVQAFEKVRAGQLKRMLAGSSEGVSAHAWAGFDAMRVLSRVHNDAPEKASRPLSASAGGFVPAAGGGLLMLESLESAQERDARIHAEVLGGWANSGGQRNGGTITASNPEGVQRCLRQTLAAANIRGTDIDYINGHLTATMADPKEIANLLAGLNLTPDRFPLINSTKSLIGHGLGASGSMECVATILQLRDGFVHASINCEDLHSQIRDIQDSIPSACKYAKLSTALKVSFGFGDVNACIIFKLWGANNEQG
ncbi:MAG TPA: beta-ketoacyl-[acyl-carrier-protein] synthase family protein [Candidatus Eisenbacteria bacterium]|nr:beta-ketoacyl-[acyl-carrier-protein] synthase family protein [Candidatus Eisenbacteria bacterium]